MLSDRRFLKAFRSRRKHVDHMHGLPAYRRWGRKLEHWNKRTTLRLLSAWIRPRRVSVPIDPAAIASVLILRPDAIGDMVLSTTIWRVLKRHYPHLTIGVVGSFRNLRVIAHDPDVDRGFELIDYRPWNLFRLLRQVRGTSWDVVLPLIYNRKTKMAILSKLCAPKGIASMVLFHDDPEEHYRKLFSIVVPSGMYTDKQPMLDLVKVHVEGTLAVDTSEDEWRPSLYPDKGAVDRIKEQIGKTLAADGTTGFIHLNLEARTPFRELGIEKSFELSCALRAHYSNVSVLWTASPASAGEIEVFLQDYIGTGIHFQRTGTIDELIGLVRAASFVITPDTSVVHIASAEQKPVVAFLRNYSEWHPYKVPHRVLIPKYGEAVSTIPIQDIIEAFGALAKHMEDNIVRNVC